MTRFAAVLATPAVMGAAPPGIEPAAYARAVIEDACEIVAGLDFVAPALVVTGAVVPEPESLVWPGTPVCAMRDGPDLLAATLAWLHGLGASEGLVLAADAPDLPPLLLGKLYRALGRAPVAYSPASGSGLVALAARLPAPAWLAGADLDAPTARLRASAPARQDLAVGPRWHRLRTQADLALLDPGLEGWEQTRALLAGDRLG